MLRVYLSDEQENSMSYRNISAPKAVDSVSGFTRKHWGAGSAMPFWVQSCLSMPVSFQDWHLAAIQEVGRSFHVGGSKTFTPNISNNCVAFSNYTVEI